MALDVARRQQEIVAGRRGARRARGGRSRLRALGVNRRLTLESEAEDGRRARRRAEAAERAALTRELCRHRLNLPDTVAGFLNSSGIVNMKSALLTLSMA